MNSYLIKKLFFTISLLFLYGANLSAQEPYGNPIETEGYTIEKGDTLWDVSDRFLNDPFRWPEVWRLNPFITNPDLIFPGEVINLTPKVEEEPISTPPEEVIEEIKEKTAVIEKEIEEVKPGPLTVSVSSMGQRRGFVSKEEMKGIGIILASREGNILMGEGDTVYVNMADERDVQDNKRFSIFDDLEEVIHPVSGDIVGHMIEIIGEIEIIEKEDDVYRAKIVDSYREILKGAKIVSYRKSPGEVVIKKGIGAVDAIILTSLDNKVTIAEKDIVFIDKGDKDGIEAGNILTIYRRGRDIPDPLSKEVVSLPLMDIGSLIIIDTQSSTSTAMVIKSKKTIYQGDIVRLCEDCI